MNVVTLAGTPYEDRSLAGWQGGVWRDMYMDLLRRAPYLATDDELLRSGEWAADPSHWYFNTSGLSRKEVRILAHFRQAAMDLWRAWDKDIYQQVDDQVRAIAERLPSLPFTDAFNEVANCRRGYQALADRKQPSEVIWRPEAEFLETLLQDGFFQTVAAYRRLAVRQLLKGRWTADEGRRFLEWVDLEYRAGRCTLIGVRRIRRGARQSGRSGWGCLRGIP